MQPTRGVFGLVPLFVAGAALAQVPVTNANSFELDNGSDAFFIFVPVATPTVGNVPGTGIVNLTPGDHMFWSVLPRELMHSSNGTTPGTMEWTSIEVGLVHSFFGIGGGGTPSVLWDMTLNPVTYVNPVSGAAGDNRRYPDLTAPPIVTLLGGPTGLPPPSIACPAPQFAFYRIAIELGNAIPGSGISLPADGSTDLAWTFWSPGGMAGLPPDPSGCEVGGNLSLMTLSSTNEHVPIGVTTGAAVPSPPGNGRSPFHGSRPTAATFNSSPATHAFSVHPGFREPVLQFRYHYSSGGPTNGGFGVMPTPERGSGAMFMDASSPSATLLPGFRTCATGHIGETVIHVLSSNLFFLGPPGIPITPTSRLLLNPADPSFFFLTPTFDVALSPNTTDYDFAVKHTADTPLSMGLAGPVAPPGFEFAVQAFIVNVAAGPPYQVISTNVAHGTIW